MRGHVGCELFIPKPVNKSIYTGAAGCSQQAQHLCVWWLYLCLKRCYYSTECLDIYNVRIEYTYTVIIVLIQSSVTFFIRIQLGLEAFIFRPTALFTFVCSLYFWGNRLRGLRRTAVPIYVCACPSHGRHRFLGPDSQKDILSFILQVL